MFLAGACGWGKKMVCEDPFKPQTQEPGYKLWNGKVYVWRVKSISNNRTQFYASSELLPQIAQSQALACLAEAG